MRHAVLAVVLVLSTTAARAEDRWMSIPRPGPMPQANEEGMADVNGIRMHYATYGAGDPVLLIHGGLGHGDIWSAQVADLMKDHLVITADSRGHGRSTRDERPYGYDLMAEDYLALLDHLGIDKVDLVGWSDGGIIGLDIAMTHPERLDHLFAQAANVTTDGVDPSVATDDVFNSYIAWMAEDYARMSPTPDQYDAFVEQISQMWASQPNWSDEELGKIAVPVTIALGDHDEAITREHTEHMAQVIPGAKVVILPEASHFAMLQAPDEYTAAVRAAIDG
ncbi:Alpha/beta hydrolase fold protein [Rubellimicrobium mesophilum DSM 19309]|uniref:Alpha/beta hydrolase fold protein n=1 Tax=Rubellimicrobium mesophilum DSM 19309 TaxID=442562 RepID=A0A017HK46_9RHOB|nr:alpha/beta fold hydrolase [Rubellimicrobium mesophilum]EYD74700.1 Alpha/beta hydrolase fold protein [Rubellimicrobium mesophilum DSM 19309]